MHHARRIRMLVILFAGAGALAVSGAAPVETADNPIVDRSQSSCATTLTATQIEILPTAGRDFAPIAGLTPGTFTPLNVSFRFNRRGAPTHVVVDGQELDFEARVRRFNPDNCEVITQTTKTVFGRDPVGGVVNFIYRTEPEPWAQINFTNLRRGGDRFSNFRLEYGRGAGTAGPIPADPGAPAGPAPGDTTPGFGGLQSLGGPIIRDGGRFNGFFQARDHDDCAGHTYNGVRLCVLGSGPSFSKVYGATDRGFRTLRLGPPKTGLSWEDAACAMDGCDLHGSFYSQPLRTRIEAVRAPSMAELFANATVYLNEGRPNANVVYFDYSATYLFQPGSTQTTSPLPGVPSVPLPPPPPAVPTDVIFRGPNGLQVRIGSFFDLNLSVLDHGDNHEKHSVVYGGQRYYMCQFEINRSRLRAFDISPERFSIEKTTRPNLGWEWRPFQCDPTGCRGEGTYFSQPVRAWTPEPPQVSPGGQSFDGKLNIELNNDVVPYRFAGKIEYKF